MSEPIVPAEYVGKPLAFIMQRENKKSRMKRDIKKWVSKNRDKPEEMQNVRACTWSDDELFERIATIIPDIKREKFDALASQLPTPPSSAIQESERIHTDLLTTYFVPLKTPSSAGPSRTGSAVSSELSQVPDSDSEEPLGRTEKLEGSSQSHCDSRSIPKEGADVGTSQKEEDETGAIPATNSEQKSNRRRHSESFHKPIVRAFLTSSAVLSSRRCRRLRPIHLRLRFASASLSSMIKNSPPEEDATAALTTALKTVPTICEAWRQDERTRLKTLLPKQGRPVHDHLDDNKIDGKDASSPVESHHHCRYYHHPQSPHHARLSVPVPLPGDAHRA
ncbi:hypothetical protein BDZ89DRAFT_1159805 [Hymenopellis radicata]|nr:hypothetical protein BDZ89DRAFT_1159805 [Hymenopellis radicata]